MVAVDSWKYDLMVDLLRELGTPGDPEKAIAAVRRMRLSDGMNIVRITGGWVDQAWPSKVYVNSNVYMVGVMFASKQRADQFAAWLEQQRQGAKA